MSGKWPSGHYDKPRHTTAAQRVEVMNQGEEIMNQRGLPYRHGYPQLPPLPVDTITANARDHIPNAQDIYERVNDLCRNSNIEPMQIFFAFRVPKVRSTESYHTLVVTASLPIDQDMSSLIMAIRTTMLRDGPLFNTAVEVIDYRALDGLHSYAVDPSETSVLDTYEDAYDITLEEIGQRNLEWVTIQVLHRGLYEEAERCPVTVVITSPSAGKEVWFREIIPVIKRRFKSHGILLDVEVLCGQYLFTTTRERETDVQDYEETVYMGSSLGQKALSDRTGTVGGMVKLSNGKKYALTNHHVVQNNVLDDLLNKEFLKTEEIEPLRPGKPAIDDNEHRFTSPSNEDHTKFLNRQTALVQSDSKSSTSPLRIKLLQIHQAELEQAKRSCRDFGTLYASSNLRRIDSEILSSDPRTGKPMKFGKSFHSILLDWALLELPDSRDMVNWLPQLPQGESKLYEPLQKGQEASKWTVMNNDKCRIMRDSVTAGKVGRTTGFTYGKINPVPLLIHPGSYGGKYKEIVKGFSMKTNDCGACLEIVGHRYMDMVVRPGDSGSIALHTPSGDWLGLIFAESPANTALFIPIDVIFRDIEEVTGLKVVEPVFNPN